MNRFRTSVTFVYFMTAIGITMFLNHPLAVALSFTGAFITSCCLKKNTPLFFIGVGFPMILFAGALNALTVHRGVTTLFYLGLNPVTLESLLYGLTRGVMLSAVILWFYAYAAVVTPDRFIAWAGRFFPDTALVLSMSLRLIPELRLRLKEVNRAQTLIGKGFSGGGFLQKFRYGAKVLGVLAAYALDNGIETAVSMQARGYGLKGAKFFYAKRLKLMDCILLLITAGSTALFITARILKAAEFSFYPRLSAGGLSAFGITALVLFGVFCFLPVLLHLAEGIKWRRLPLKN